MSIFDGLDDLGFREAANEEHSLFAKKEVKVQTKPVEQKQLAPEDCLYEKAIPCPICDFEFKEFLPIKSKLRLQSTDTDLRSYFMPIDPIYYDIYMCKKCGYTALASFFERISERQKTLIGEKITSRYKAKNYPKMITTELAIERYKFALLNANTKGSKNSEKAYLCLRIAWLYRDKKDEANEKVFLQNAYSGFLIAFETEHFPVCGIDDNVMTYMLGEFARRLGLLNEASKWMSSVIVKKEINPRLKDRAMMQNEIIRAELSRIK